MASEPKHCPFCGKTEQEVSDVHISTGWESADICCEGCGAQVVRYGNTPEEARKNVLEAWNTRAERTCRIEPGTDEETAKRGPFESYLSCSECRGPIQHTNYCPNCGAKVVE